MDCICSFLSILFICCVRWFLYHAWRWWVCIEFMGWAAGWGMGDGGDKEKAALFGDKRNLILGGWGDA